MLPHMFNRQPSLAHQCTSRMAKSKAKEKSKEGEHGMCVAYALGCTGRCVVMSTYMSVAHGGAQTEPCLLGAILSFFPVFLIILLLWRHLAAELCTLVVGGKLHHATKASSGPWVAVEMPQLHRHRSECTSPSVSSALHEPEQLA